MDFAIPDKPVRRGTAMTEDEDDFSDNEEFIPPTDASPDLDRDSVQELFNQEISDAEALSRRKFDSDRDKKSMKSMQIAFVNDRVSKWDRVTTMEDRNFLHHLAYYKYNPRSPITLQWLMMRAIFNLPHLMGDVDDSKRTPLTVALATGNEVFVHAACKNQPLKIHPELKKALSRECENYGNDRDITCLHTALTCTFIQEEDRRDYIRAMCQFIPEEMFTVTDIEGRTPLHLAVEYERCCKTQVDIVSDLLRRGSKALEVPLFSRYSKRSLSVYQYHRSSQNQPEKKSQRRVTRGGRPAQAAAKEINGADDMKADLKKATSKNERNSMGPPRWSGKEKLRNYKERPDTNAPSNMVRRDSMRISTTESQNGDYSVQSIDILPSPRPQSPGAMKLRTAQGDAVINAQLQRDEEKKQAFELITEQLKLGYLRTQGPHAASISLNFHEEKGAFPLTFLIPFRRCNTRHG